jgi:hypothetical protein
MPELTNRRRHQRGGRWTLTERLILLKIASRACLLAYVRADDLQEALAPLLAFMGAQPLTQAISDLEASLGGCHAEEIPATLRRHDVSPSLLRSAFVARERFGRINDVIHAAAIVLALPALLDDAEVLKRPSLAAGNDPSRPFDVETDRRVAEFKFSRWDGHDAGRKRQLFKDLVHLAAADLDGRTAQLYVLGSRPIMFLHTTISTAGWALNRMADETRRLFEDRFGPTTIRIPDFVRGPASHVEIVNLELVLPEYFAVEAAQAELDAEPTDDRLAL